MKKPCLILVLFLLLASPGHAQEEVLTRRSLPRSVADRVVDYYNAETTIRFTGNTNIPAGSRIIGDVAVLGGHFALEGVVEGSVTVINGDLILGEESAVSGNVLVVGGRLTEAEGSRVEGSRTVYRDALRYARRGRRGDRISYTGPTNRTGRGSLVPTLGFGSSRITVKAGTNYNRVEGLPVLVGPLLESGGDNPFKLEALGIWRTDTGLDIETDELGYVVEASQAFGGREAGFSLGASLHSTVEPIESWGLSDLESSLGAFLFHTDYRDYYDREGWGAFLRMRPSDGPLSFRFEYRDDTHDFLPVGGPLTLRDNDEPWRPQPLVGVGALRSLGLDVTVDTRNSSRDPSDGWLLHFRGLRGLGGTLDLPGHFATLEGGGPSSQVVARQSINPQFTKGSIDLRRYLRIAPGAALAFRVLAAGSLDDKPLPPQFQTAFGGEGSLPGYRLLQHDCGARDQESGILLNEGSVSHVAPVFRGYGCNRMALFQVEYRGDFFFEVHGPGWDDKPIWFPEIDFSPSWTFFFNAGRGWAAKEADSIGFLGTDTDWFTDLGVGLFVGDLGLYWAFPLDGEGRDANFFLRVDRRF